MHSDNLGYHPIRFAYQLEDFFKTFIARWEQARQDVPENAGGLLAGLMLEHAFRDMIREHADSLPVHIVEHAAWWGPHIEHAVSAYKDYRQEHDEIHHFAPDLALALSKASPPDLKYTDLQLPCQTFYIRFDHAVSSGPMKIVDGVYVKDYTDLGSDFDPAVEFTFTSVTPSFHYGKRIPPIQFLTTDPTYSFLLMFDEEKTVAESLASCLREETQEVGWDSDAGLDWFPIMPKLMGLVMNCLSYMSRHDGEYAYPHYTPESMLAAVREASDEVHREQALDVLYAHGFRQITFHYE
jgi:hypothetical protein